MVKLELGLFLPQKSKLELGSSRAPSTKKKNKKQERKKERKRNRKKGWKKKTRKHTLTLDVSSWMDSKTLKLSSLSSSSQNKAEKTSLSMDMSYILFHTKNFLKNETLFLCLLYQQFKTQGLSCAFTLTSFRGFCFNFLQGETSRFLINSCP